MRDARKDEVALEKITRAWTNVLAVEMERKAYQGAMSLAVIPDHYCCLGVVFALDNLEQELRLYHAAAYNSIALALVTPGGHLPSLVSMNTQFLVKTNGLY